MVYITYPQESLLCHDDYINWVANTNKQEGDWKSLRVFLALHPRLGDEIHAIPKCWYSELPQGDKAAQDVEHFRPKNKAEFLSLDKIEKIEKLAKVPFKQENASGAYKWLEFDHRNYRLVTASANRAGAKHYYFPIVAGTSRLAQGEMPWISREYPYLLDPCDREDANLLLVLPSGQIIPRESPVEITEAEITDLPSSWRNPSFGYMRAWVTIVLYRLNENDLVPGRQEVFVETMRLFRNLEILIFEAGPHSKTVKNGIEDIKLKCMPSAPFSLAARCALKAQTNPILEKIASRILLEIETQIDNCKVQWEL